MKTLLNFKLWSCLLIILYSTIIANSQNLVPNWSFEDTITVNPPYTITACPSDADQTYFCKDWIININTADYYNACSNSFVIHDYGVPSNWAGYQEAATGSCYMGLQNYNTFWGYNYADARELIGCRLINPLTIGNLYYASLKVSRAEEGFCAASGFGLKLTNEIYWWVDTTYITTIGVDTSVIPEFYHSEFPNPIDSLGINCQLSYDSIIQNTNIWTIIEGSFIADSAYQYLLVGNFLSRANVDSIVYSQGPNCHGVYYYIDDVCISENPSDCGINPEVIKTKPKEYFEIIEAKPGLISINYISQERAILRIYSIVGDILITKSITQGLTEIPIQNLTYGIYFISISNENFISTKKIFIKSMSN
ncbi:MAG: T9SS type A sorting domain-containing protein [Bacteroidota bacterium]